jgi:hypothetical protein
MLTLAIFCIRLLTVLFFVGLVGCSAVVVFSWISIFTSGFSNDDIETGERHAGHTSHRSIARGSAPIPLP